MKPERWKQADYDSPSTLSQGPPIRYQWPLEDWEKQSHHRIYHGKGVWRLCDDCAKLVVSQPTWRGQGVMLPWRLEFQYGRIPQKD